jgi:hypothetical protein
VDLYLLFRNYFFGIIIGQFHGHEVLVHLSDGIFLQDDLLPTLDLLKWLVLFDKPRSPDALYLFITFTPLFTTSLKIILIVTFWLLFNCSFRLKLVHLLDQLSFLDFLGFLVLHRKVFLA